MRKTLLHFYVTTIIVEEIKNITRNKRKNEIIKLTFSQREI